MRVLCAAFFATRRVPRPARASAGYARLGYQAASREERFDIAGYGVVWLRPADGSNSPIAVYLRTLPPGFPQLKARAPGVDGTVLHEEITVTGVFFKRWLYGSRGGLNLAPLILGQITQWTRPPQASTNDGSWHAHAAAIGYAVLCAAVVGLALTVWVYCSSRWSGRERAPAAAAPSELPPFDQQSMQATVTESLRRMTIADGAAPEQTERPPRNDE